MRKLLWLSATALLAGCALVQPPPTSNTFVVFFGSASSALTPQAKTEIDLAAAEIKSTHAAHVVIATYTKAVAGDASNPKLADPRFDVVEGALVADGVDAHILARAMLTDMEVKADPTGDHRVEIRLFKD